MSFATDDAAESQISVPVAVMHVGSSEETVSGTRVIPEAADGCRVLAPCRGTGIRNSGRQAEKTFKQMSPSYFTRQRPRHAARGGLDIADESLLGRVTAIVQEPRQLMRCLKSAQSSPMTSIAI